ncbi:RDD family protein [Streptomyces canus]|uniref:RDD family protein n=1 Tax=Streptomyces canus TaxID=58343 RepID=UPI00277EC932|nr:RDD family protein [Streptomyces canus]MDQ1070215.1 putative RDD family membrane protein YckC [Streptomyces canus]
MSAPTPAPGDDRPREGYYPDPSIPGYVRYWNGSSWVPGTSRPAPAAGEPLGPPAGGGPASAPVEETGPHFFDEDPAEEAPHPGTQHGSRPEPASAWGADRAHQAGFGGDQDRRVSWGSPQGPAQAQQGAQQGPPQGGEPQGAAHGGAQQGGTGGPQGARHGGVPQQSGPRGADPRVVGAGRPADGASPAQADGHDARTDGTATIPPTEPDEDGGTRVFRRPTAGSGGAGAAQQSDDGTMKFRAVSPRTAQQSGGAGAQNGSTPGPAYSGPTAQGGQGGPAGSAVAPTGPQGPGFGAGKAARAAATGAPGPQGPASAAAAPLSGPQQSTPASGPQTAPPGVPQQGVPQQGVPQQQGPQQVAGVQPAGAQPPATPMSAGPGGGQPSWAQQVHRLAGPDEEQPAPWKPPVEDIFQAAARRQASARPAGLGKRLAARLLDTLVVGAVTAVVAVPLGTKAADHINEKVDAAKLSGETVTVWLLDGTTSVYLGIVVAVLLVAGALYEALPTAKWGRTLGKKLLGLEVRDIEGHEPPSFAGALRRWLVYSVPGLLGIGLVGVAWCLFDRPWRQCWHDKAAHTFVAG